ncbi:MAG: energy transducer TonB [Cyclobacteriaceae bacterium]
MEPKKNPKADLRQRRWMFFFAAMTVTLSLTLTAFEWKSFDDTIVMDLGDLQDDFDDIIDIPLTEQPPPPPPKIELPQIVEVPDEVELEEEDFEIDVEVDETTVIEDIIIDAEPIEEEVITKIFDIVEDKPQFPGGDGAMYKFLGKGIDYPSQARRMGIEGRVFVQFVVNPDGSVTDVKSIKGIGAGCDIEAARVIKSMPKWSPGKQRGVPVKVRMVIPVYFKLNN